MNEIIEQLDTQGYSIVRNFMDTSTTARVRAHIEALLPPVASPEASKGGPVNGLRHPIPGAIMADILANPQLIELARQILYSNELRMLEQVLIRTDPVGLPSENQKNSRATGWHIDMVFLPEHYHARPRQTYFHMVQALNTVGEGGGGTTVVPGSHLQTLAAAQEIGDPSQLDTLKNNPVEMAGIDLRQAIELHPQKGDLLIFNPMCLHSPTSIINGEPRYVYFASFYDSSAEYLKNFLASTDYDNKNLPDSLRDNLPDELASLLD